MPSASIGSPYKVSRERINDNAINVDKIDDDAVETAKIKDDNITVPKINFNPGSGVVVATDGTGDFNGTTEVEIQAAINSLPSTGGIVYIKKGTYTISKAIIINVDNTSLFGVGVSTKLLAATTPSLNTISATGVSNILIRDLYIYGNYGSIPLNANRGILLTSVNDSVIENCFIENTSYGISMVTCSHIKICFCSFQTTRYDGIGISGSTNSTIIENEIISNTNNGIDIDSSSDYNKVYGNYIESVQIGIVIYGNYNVVMGNISTLNTWGITSANNSNNTIANNVCYLNNRDGIELYNSDYNAVTGNVLKNNSQAANNTYSEIYMHLGSTYNSITGNTILCNSVKKSICGIRELSSSDNYNVITGNVVTGANLTNIALTGANSISFNNIEG